MSPTTGSSDLTLRAPRRHKDPSAATRRGRARRVSPLAGYELWAPTYDQDVNPLLALEERELGGMLPELAGKRVLDAGCGTGRWLEKLLTLGAGSGIGIDLSAAMLDEAARKPRVRGRLLVGNVLALPLGSSHGAGPDSGRLPRRIDLIVCSFAIGHLADTGALERLAKEMARVIAPQGDVFLSEMHSRGYFAGWRCAFRRGEETIEIPTTPHSAEQVAAAFRGRFDLLECREAWLGEPERRYFELAGKRDEFDAACAQPAVLICHFRRAGMRR